jgi:hypothetical protein
MGNLQVIKQKATAEYERVRRETGCRNKSREYLVQTRRPLSTTCLSELLVVGWCTNWWG